MVEAREPAYSLKAAGELLRVSPQRINQLLAAGTLEGPTYTGLRAPRGAERVWVTSLQIYKGKLETGTPAANHESASTDLAKHVQDLEHAVNRLTTSATTGDALVRRERAARQAAHTLKVEADDFREKLQSERTRNQELEGQLAALRAELAHTKADVDESETLRLTLDEALTLLLAPDGPSDM